MVRRVGFGDSKEKRSDLTSVPVTKSNPRAAKTDAKSMSLPARVFAIIFLCIWLLGWSGAIIFATYELFAGNDFSKFFLIFWIILASGGWLFALKTLRALLRGEQISGGVIRERKPRVSDTENTPATRPEPVPNARNTDASIKATQLTKNELMFKIGKIIVAVLIAIRIESNFMFIVLFLWAGKEAWSILRPSTPSDPEQ